MEFAPRLPLWVIAHSGQRSLGVSISSQTTPLHNLLQAGRLLRLLLLENYSTVKAFLSVTLLIRRVRKCIYSPVSGSSLAQRHVCTFLICFKDECMRDITQSEFLSIIWRSKSLDNLISFPIIVLFRRSRKGNCPDSASSQGRCGEDETGLASESKSSA